MELFIVVRTGIYMQGIVGVYTSDDAARLAAERARVAEPDDYHDFEVHPIKADDDAMIGITADDR